MHVHGRAAPAARALLLSKVTFGGVGTFPFRVRPAGGGTPLSASATTTEPETPVAAEPGPFELDPGDTSGRALPDARGGRWHQTAVNCNARRSRSPRAPTADRGDHRLRRRRGLPVREPLRPVRLDHDRQGDPRGGRDDGLRHLAGRRPRPPVRQERDHDAATAAPARARGLHAAPAARPLRDPGDRHGVRRDGRWTLLAAICDGRLRAFEQGQVEVPLTTDRPRVRCRFINAFTPDVPPVPPRPPVPPAPARRPVRRRAARGRPRRDQARAAAPGRTSARSPGSRSPSATPVSRRRTGRPRRCPRRHRAVVPRGPARAAATSAHR